MNFKSVDYLKNGSQLQKETHKVLTENRVMHKLVDFQPLLVGTIPIDIAIKDSDLDIVCSFDCTDTFKVKVQNFFNLYPQFSVNEKIVESEATVIVRFKISDFPVEIFAQRKPSNEQIAYQHMLIEHQILNENGSFFREEIVRLKKSGMKTEPAFAQLLNLKGDPFVALLDYGKLRGFI